MSGHRTVYYKLNSSFNRIYIEYFNMYSWKFQLLNSNVSSRFF